MVIVHLFKLVRAPNLVLVALIQCGLQFFILKPILASQDIALLLSDSQFFVLVFCTVLLTAGGYVINDILDMEVDKVNKPKKVIIGEKLSVKSAWTSYLFVIILGGVLAIILSIMIKKPFWFAIYPLACLSLYFYSKYLKKRALLGNILVSLFCAGVPYILIFAEQEAIQKLKVEDVQSYQYLAVVFAAYIIYSFLTTMFRELIKDMEDMKGDQQAKHSTLPIQIGIERTKVVAAFFQIITLLLLLAWFFWEENRNHPWRIAILFTAIVIPISYTILKTFSAHSKDDFSKLSLWSKLIMVGGIIIIPIYHML